MKRQPRLTKSERKAAAPKRPAQPAAPTHIHCIACGRHLNPSDFEVPMTATVITCNHGSNFPSCITCMMRSQALIAEHDRTNRPVRAARAVH